MAPITARLTTEISCGRAYGERAVAFDGADIYGALQLLRGGIAFNHRLYRRCHRFNPP